MGFDFAQADDFASSGNSITRAFGLSGFRAGFQPGAFQSEAFQTARRGVSFGQATTLTDTGLTMTRTTSLAS